MKSKDVIRRVEKNGVMTEVDISPTKVLSQKVYDKHGNLLNMDRSDATYGYPADMSREDMWKQAAATEKTKGISCSC